MTYELFCAPTLAQSVKEGTDLSQLTHIERRLAQLEKLLGTSTFMVWRRSLGGTVRTCNDSHCVQGNMPTSDLLQVVEMMNDKLDLLNRSELEKVDRKLKMMSLELDDIVRSEERIGLPAHQEKKVFPSCSYFLCSACSCSCPSSAGQRSV